MKKGRTAEEIEFVISKFFSGRDQAFTHLEDQISYATTDIYKEIIRAEMEPCRFVIDPTFLFTLIVKRDADPTRARALTPIQRILPMLFANQDDGTQLLIDGTHRYLRCILDEDPWAMCFLVDKALWSKHITKLTREQALFLTKGSPERLGLTESRHFEEKS